MFASLLELVGCGAIFEVSYNRVGSIFVSEIYSDSSELKQKSSVLRARPQLNMFGIQARALKVDNTK